MIRIAVVDDEEKYVSRVREFLLQFFENDETRFHLTSFSNGLDFIDPYNAAYDIIFLDIEMPSMDGIEMAQRLRAVDTQVILIYMTRMAQYAALGYDVDAIGFLIKPLTYSGFALKLKKAIQILDQRKTVHVVVKEKQTKRVIASDDIYYLEATNHRVVLHTKHGEITSWGSLREYAEMLSDAHFANCSRDYLVNLKYVHTVQERDIEVGGDVIPMSRDKKKQFMSQLTQFYGGV